MPAGLRRALDAADPGLRQTDDHELVLNRRRLTIDALALEVGDADVAALAPFDDDWLLRHIEIADPLFDEWLASERVRWRTRLHHRLEACAQARLAADDPSGAIALAVRLVAFEPPLEASHRILMQAHATQGNGSLARRQFDLCRESLAEDRRGPERGDPGSPCRHRPPSTPRAPDPASMPADQRVQALRGGPSGSASPPFGVLSEATASMP